MGSIVSARRAGSTHASNPTTSITADVRIRAFSTNDIPRRIIERLRLMRSARQLVELALFTVGIRVEFTTDDGRTLQGEITRLNRKTATICCNPSGHWRVSPSLLRPVRYALVSSPSAARVLPISAERRRH